MLFFVLLWFKVEHKEKTTKEKKKKKKKRGRIRAAAGTEKRRERERERERRKGGRGGEEGNVQFEATLSTREAAAGS